jgi:hypothetical protein
MAHFGTTDLDGYIMLIDNSYRRFGGQSITIYQPTWADIREDFKHQVLGLLGMGGAPSTLIMEAKCAVPYHPH